MAELLEAFYYGGHVVSERRALTNLCILLDKLHLATPYSTSSQLPGVVGFKRASRVLAAKRGVGALAARAVLDMLVEMLRRERLFLTKLDGEKLIRKKIIITHGDLPGTDDGARARLLSAPKAKLASIFRAGAASVAVATGLTSDGAPRTFIGNNPEIPVPAAAVLLSDGDFVSRRLEALVIDLPWIQAGPLLAPDLFTARDRLAKQLTPFRQYLAGLLASTRELLAREAPPEAIRASAEQIIAESIAPACEELQGALDAGKGAAFRKLRRKTGTPLRLALRVVPAPDLQKLIDSGIEIVGGLTELLGGRGNALARVMQDGNLSLELRPREVSKAIGIKIVRKRKAEPDDAEASAADD